MSIWFTSDHHFGHKNIIKYCNRPFMDVEEMESVMISSWNMKIKPKDTVYYLGDFTLQNKKYAENIISKLNGNILFVAGGHDNWLPSNSVKLLSPLVHLKGMFQKNNRGLPLILCHYPMVSWEQSHYGSIHLHGHTHGTIENSISGDIQLPPGEKQGKRMDVGVDTNNFSPYSLDKILKEMT